MLDMQLTIFKTVADQKSFSKAAQILHLTQSAVSQQIQHLEEYYGVKLFDRFYRRIEITAAGTALYPYAENMEKLCREAEKTLSGFSGEVSGRLQIAASLTTGEYVLPRILVEFQQMYPRVDMSMDVCNTEDVLERVRDGKVNVGFVEGPFLPSEHLACLPCGGDRLVVVAAGGLARQEKLAIADLLREKWILREPTSGTRRVFENFLQEHDFDAAGIQIVMELASTQAIKEAVAAGVGISVLSCKAVKREIQQGDLQEIPLLEGDIRRSFTMVYYKERFRTCAVETFLAFVIAWLQVQQTNQQPAERA